MTDLPRYHGTAFGFTEDRLAVRVVCFGCEEEIVFPLDVPKDVFFDAWKAFSEAHKPCRNGQEEWE